MELIARLLKLELQLDYALLVFGIVGFMLLALALAYATIRDAPLVSFTADRTLQFGIWGKRSIAFDDIMSVKTKITLVGPQIAIKDKNNAKETTIWTWLLRDRNRLLDELRSVTGRPIE